MAGIIHSDLLEEIFSWLPPESLMRFKCVSKTLYGLINSLVKSPVFVNKHLRNIDKANLSATCVLVCYYRFYYLWKYPVSEPESVCAKLLLNIFHDDNKGSDRINCVSEDLDLPTPPGKYIHSAMVSHCDGIICMVYDSTVILCNPAIKEWRTLPKLSDYDDRFFMPLGLGFGYDSRANDYKVINIWLYKSFVGKVKARVYSLGTDSWRDIGIPPGFEPLALDEREVFWKGVFYWFILYQEKAILAFDIFDGIFYRLPLPNNFIMKQGDQIKLALWNDSVASILYSVMSEEVSRSIEVGVMDEWSGGVKGCCSWIKKLVIGPLETIATPLTFLKNYELRMAIDRELVSYNRHSQILRELTFPVVSKGAPCVCGFSYVKSLVSVKGGSLSH